MKNIKLKIMSIILLITIFTLELSPFAVKATAQQLQFYSQPAVVVGYDSYNGKNVFYANATLGGVTAYCVDYTCAVPSGTMRFRAYLSDAAMAVLVNGYPNNSAAALGCASEDEAYMATQMALWEVLNRTGESQKAGRIFRVDNVTPKSGMEDFYARSVSAAQRLVAIAEANPYTSTPNLVVNTQSVAKREIGSDVLIGPYKVRVDGIGSSSLKAINVSLSGAPASARITDGNGNNKGSIANNDEVYVRFSSYEESTTFNVNFSADIDRKVGVIYASSGTTQDFVRLDSEPQSASTSTTIKWTKVNTIGEIELEKVDQSGEPVVGAVFRLEKEDGTVVHERMETGGDGKIKYTNVPAGNYRLVEISAPEGYVIKSQSTNVTVVAGETSHVKVVNERITGQIVITKVDDANRPLANVTFEIYDSEGYLVTSVTTDENGKASANVGYGKYYFKEVSAPEGYIMDDTLYRFNVTEENRTFYQTVTNERQKGSLLVVKTDDEKQPIEGVKFDILDSKGNLVITITTDKDGLAGVKNLPLGTYYYQEVYAPDNVVMDNTAHEFKVEKQDQVVRVDVVNEKIRGRLKITKVNELDKAIGNVKFEILDKDKKVIQTIITDENGIAESMSLEKGTYYYREVSAPEGYVFDNEEHEFNITTNNQVENVKVVNNTAKGSLKITKYTNGGEVLAGVKFNILNEDKEVVDTIVTNKLGIATSKKLPLGMYYYQEIEAPDDVVMDTELHPFVLTENEQVVSKVVVNKFKTGKLRIEKVDEENKPLAGVKFNILDKDMKIVDTIVTDKDGYAESSSLLKGKYYFQEVEAPEGIVVDDTIYEFELESDGQVINKKIVNKYAKGNLVITKYDSNGRLLKDVKFEILNEFFEVVDVITTDENGVAISKMLKAGKYFFREIEAPDNVIMDTQLHEFVLKENNQVVTKEVVNELIEGKLKIIKVDENDKPLAGVKFNILDEDKNVIDTIVTDKDGIAVSKELEKGKYYYQEIEAPEGIIVDTTAYEFEIVEDGQNVIKNMINYYEKGQIEIQKYDSNNNKLSNVKFNILDEDMKIVDTIVTNENGVATSKKLPLGKYFYKEIEAPNNVIMDTQLHEFVLTENNQVITKTVINELIEGKLKIIKVDENNVPLAGVKFNILDNGMNVIDTIVTDKDGIAVSKELEKGKYYYQEVEAPEGIIVDTTVYEFEIVEDGQNVIKNMINYYAKGQLEVQKYDSRNNRIPNVKFNILDENMKVVDTIVTDENGVAISNKLPLGKYYYQEIEAPDNVIMDTQVREFVLTENNQVIEKIVVNKLIEGKLKIIKVDENDVPLAGVKFNILDEDKKLVDTIVTDENGIAESRNLEKGKYYYQEVEAPEGIVVDNTMYEFEIVEDGQNVIENMINCYIKGQLKITKLVDGTNEALKDVKFAILDEDRSVVETIITNEEGIATSSKLPYGTYYFKEIDAPDGYVVDKTEHGFTIVEDGDIIEAVVYNEKAQLPVTGGFLNLNVQIILTVLSIFGYIGYRFLFTNKEENF